MVNVMVANIDRKPVQPTRQNQKTCSLDRPGVVVPMLVVARIGMFKIMLNGEQNNTRAAGNRYAGYINGKKQRRTACPGHQRPNAEQHDIVPEHMPILFGRLPIAGFKTGGVLLDRYVWLRQFLSDNMDHQLDTAFYPGKARVKNQIYKARNGRGRD